MGEVIQFPLHKTKAWRENKKLEQELLAEIEVLDAAIAQGPCHCVHCEQGLPGLCMVEAMREP